MVLSYPLAKPSAVTWMVVLWLFTILDSSDNWRLTASYLSSASLSDALMSLCRSTRLPMAVGSGCSLLCGLLVRYYYFSMSKSEAVLVFESLRKN